MPDNDYARFIAEYHPEAVRPGKIRDGDYHELGTHQGIYNFTIGQRKGLGIATGSPLYVNAINPETAEVVVGPEAQNFRHRVNRLRPELDRHG